MSSQNNESTNVNQNQNGGGFGFFFPLNFAFGRGQGQGQEQGQGQGQEQGQGQGQEQEQTSSPNQQGQIPQIHFFIYPTEGNDQTPPGAFFFTPFFMPQQEINKPRASESAIKKLPIVTITQKHVDAQVSCPICLEHFSLSTEQTETKTDMDETDKIEKTDEKTDKTNKAVRQMPCNHVFCESCLFQWLRQNNSCPLCRKEIEAEITSGAQQNNNNNTTNSSIFGVINITNSPSTTPSNSPPPPPCPSSNATTTSPDPCALANVGCCEEIENNDTSVAITLPQCNHRFHASCLRTSLLIEGYPPGDFNSTSRPLNFRCPTCRTPAVMQSDALKTPGTPPNDEQQESTSNLTDNMDLD